MESIDAIDEGKVIIKCGDGRRLTYDRNAIREVVECSKHMYKKRSEVNLI